jgi:hypothetical protein
MPAQLGSIIDQLYREKQSGLISKRKIVFLVGSGIRHICNILNDDQIKKEITKRPYINKDPKSQSFQEFRWRLFEYARYYTANALPTFAHACIFQMIKDGLCRDLITTNYDLFFDAIWEKYPELGVKQNPVCNQGDYHWDGYYSYKKHPRGKPRYWKIHGSLSHIVFQGRNPSVKPQIHRLPRFACSTNQPDLAKYYGDKCLAPFMGFETSQYRLTKFTHPYLLQSQFEPFIDWTFGNKRSLFDCETRSASRILKDEKNVAAIVIIGFRGYYNDADIIDPWNEELVPVLTKVLDAGKIEVFIALHKYQYQRSNEPTSGFARRLIKDSRCFVYDDVSKFIQALLNPPNCHLFPFETVKNEFDIWRNYWFINMKEQLHG